MRVLFTTYSERTHFLLLAPLAWALRTAGHEVCVAVQPKLVDTVTEAGLTAVPVGHDRDLWEVVSRIGPVHWFGKESGLPAPYDVVTQRPEDITWEHLLGGYRDIAIRWHKMSNVPMIAELVDYARYWRPDLVIWEPTTFAGAVAAKACGAAHARMLIGADVHGIARRHFLRLKETRAPEDRADPLADWLGGYAEECGQEFTEDMTTGHFTIDSLPPSLCVEADLPYLFMRYVSYGGRAVIPDWLRRPAQRRRVVFTMGLTAFARTGEYPVAVPEILDALSDVDAEVVATIAADGLKQLPSVPDNATIVPYAPLQSLLPTCSAAIHHAGVGTLATTAQHAVPQLTVPWDVDQPLLSARLVTQGSGLCVPAAEATGQAVRDGVLELLSNPSFAENAARLREEMLSLPTPNELVPQLEELTVKHRADG
ncbi:activator-dependent family glycosyltransferase [Amycolatopsis lurida]